MKWWERVAHSPHAKKSEYLKYLKNFEKRSKLTKNLDFFTRGEHASLSSFWGKLGYSQTKFDRKIYHFIVDSLLKDAVITVGVSLHLCLLSLCIYESLQYIQICQWRHCTLGWMHAFWSKDTLLNLDFLCKFGFSEKRFNFFSLRRSKNGYFPNKSTSSQWLCKFRLCNFQYQCTKFNIFGICKLLFKKFSYLRKPCSPLNFEIDIFW